MKKVGPAKTEPTEESKSLSIKVLCTKLLRIRDLFKHDKETTARTPATGPDAEAEPALGRREDATISNIPVGDIGNLFAQGDQDHVSKFFK